MGVREKSVASIGRATRIHNRSFAYILWYYCGVSVGLLTVEAGVSMRDMRESLLLGLFSFYWVAMSSLDIRTFAMFCCIFSVVFGWCLLKSCSILQGSLWRVDL